MNASPIQPPATELTSVSARTWKVSVALWVLVFATAAWTAFSRGLYSDDFMVLEHDAGQGIAASLFRKNFRPLQGGIRGIISALCGANIGRIHVLAAVVHATNSALLFHLLLARGVRIRIALISAGIFAFHPSASEAVFWTICLPHYLLAMLAFLVAALLATARDGPLKPLEIVLLTALGYFSMALHETFFALYLILLPAVYSRAKASPASLRVALVVGAALATVGALATHILLMRPDRAEALQAFEIVSGSIEVLRLAAMRCVGAWTWDLGGAAIARLFGATLAQPLVYSPWIILSGLAFYIFAKGSRYPARETPSIRAAVSDRSFWPVLSPDEFRALSSIIVRCLPAIFALASALVPFGLMKEESRYLPPRYAYFLLVPILIITAEAFRGITDISWSRLRDAQAARAAAVALDFMYVLALASTFVLAFSMMGVGIQYADCARLQDRALGGLAEYARQNPDAPVQSIDFIELPTKVGLAKTFIEPWATKPAIRYYFRQAELEPADDLNVLFRPRIDTAEDWDAPLSDEADISCLYADDGSFHFWREIERVDVSGGILKIIRPRRDAPAPATLRIERWSPAQPASPPSGESPFFVSGMEAWSDSAGLIYFILELEPTTRADPKKFRVTLQLEDTEGKITEIFSTRMRKNRGDYRERDGVFRYRIAPSQLPPDDIVNLSIQIEQDGRVRYREALQISSR